MCIIVCYWLIHIFLRKTETTNTSRRGESLHKRPKQSYSWLFHFEKETGRRDTRAKEKKVGNNDTRARKPQPIQSRTNKIKNINPQSQILRSICISKYIIVLDLSYFKLEEIKIILYFVVMFINYVPCSVSSVRLDVLLSLDCTY